MNRRRFFATFGWRSRVGCGRVGAAAGRGRYEAYEAAGRVAQAALPRRPTTYCSKRRPSDRAAARLNDEKRPGTFICAACYLPLFDASTKYESGTGWPSFYAPIEGRLETKRDWKLVLPRTEYHCARCEGHQGHVFGDGPAPTG